jgi:hypothetical protein
MSHTGYKRRIRKPFVSEDFKPKQVEVSNSTINIKGIYEGDMFEGELSGNGEVVLVGLSNLDDFDDNNVFDGAQKGVAVGYTQSSQYFNIYTNNGTGNPVTITPLSTFKDNELHNFIITIYQDKVTVRFDGQENTLTSNIPVLSDSLKVITKGFY